MEARGKVKDLFKGQADLLLEFDDFLPLHPSSDKNWQNNFDENVKKNPTGPHPRFTTCPAHINNSVEKGSTCTVPQLEQSPPKIRSVSKTGVAVSQTADPASAAIVEKRKWHDRPSDNGSLRVNFDSLGGTNKKRLISISKLQNTVKRCIEGQGKDSWLEPPRSIRKFRGPEHLALTTYTDGELIYQRYYH